MIYRSSIVQIFDMNEMNYMVTDFTIILCVNLNIIILTAYLLAD